MLWAAGCALPHSTGRAGARPVVLMCPSLRVPPRRDPRSITAKPRRTSAIHIHNIRPGAPMDTQDLGAQWRAHVCMGWRGVLAPPIPDAPPAVRCTRESADGRSAESPLLAPQVTAATHLYTQHDARARSTNERTATNTA